MIRRRRLLQGGAAAGCMGGAGWSLSGRGQAIAGAPVRVAAASDLKFALTLIANQFQKETGHGVALSFGSSGNFAQQIAQGLPVDLFMSADEAYVFRLTQAGMTRVLDSSPGAPAMAYDQGSRYATGRIALLLAKSSTIALDARLSGLQSGWHQVTKFALANPEHAPYGRAAKQALLKLGLWEMVRPKLVLGENIAQATQFVTSGAAQAGITALSLALAPQVASSSQHLRLPDSLHEPLHQRMVLLKSANAGAVAFYAYLQSPAARAVLTQYGFAHPSALAAKPAT